MAQYQINVDSQAMPNALKRKMAVRLKLAIS